MFLLSRLECWGRGRKLQQGSGPCPTFGPKDRELGLRRAGVTSSTAGLTLAQLCHGREAAYRILLFPTAQL